MTDQPLAPPPDDKDWTWVLETPCPECGFDATSVERESIGAILRDNVAAWQEILRHEPASLRQRPEPTTWSALEYACHIRDVLGLYSERLTLMLTEDGPHYANWDQDVTAIEHRYDLADPSAVSAELAALGSALADQFDAVAGDQWERTGHRSDGATFTVESFARYFIHDPLHHLWDVA